jgi:hypothetical protein
MSAATVLDREEYIEQAYFFRVLRERLAEGMATQEILHRIDQEILSTTRLPYAIQFLAAELKHSGLLSSGFARLSHYFTAYQAFVFRGTENDVQKFSADTALLVMEREAEYRAGRVSPSGLFVYQFEVLCRNRLGYVEGLRSMAQDPYYSAEWKGYLEGLMEQVGLVDFADLVYLRSDQYLADQHRTDPQYVPSLPMLFGEKEGKIAAANRGRDPLYLFAALQRHLGYPEVPQAKPRDDWGLKWTQIQMRFQNVENRLKLLESEIRGNVDLSQFGRPDLLTGPPEIEI